MISCLVLPADMFSTVRVGRKGEPSKRQLEAKKKKKSPSLAWID